MLERDVDVGHAGRGSLSVVNLTGAQFRFEGMGGAFGNEPAQRLKPSLQAAWLLPQPEASLPPIPAARLEKVLVPDDFPVRPGLDLVQLSLLEPFAWTLLLHAAFQSLFWSSRLCLAYDYYSALATEYCQSPHARYRHRQLSRHKFCLLGLGTRHASLLVTYGKLRRTLFLHGCARHSSRLSFRHADNITADFVRHAFTTIARIGGGGGRGASRGKRLQQWAETHQKNVSE